MSKTADWIWTVPVGSTVQTITRNGKRHEITACLGQQGYDPRDASHVERSRKPGE